MENKIYVGTYHKYNSGSIEGAWIDLENLSKEEFYQKCKELHQDEEDPEFMFQDFEIEDILSDYVDETGIDPEFWELKEQLENTDFDLEALQAYKSIFGEINFRDFEDKFFAHIDDYNVNRAFGDYMLEEMGELEQVPQHLRYYIDSELYGRDLLINDFSEHNGFVFRNC